MTSDLEQRLHRYRSRLDKAIADDLASRGEALPQRRAKRRSLVGVAAVAIVTVGVGSLTWTATYLSGSSQQSEAPATTTPLEAEPPPATGTPTAGTDLDGTTTGGAPPGGSERLALGNNVMLGAAADLVEFGFVVDAVEARQFRDLVELTASLAADGELGQAVVIHAGTNGSIQSGDLDELASNLAAVGNIYLLTDAIERPWVEPNNELMRTFAANNANVTVIDWATAASSCSGDCFYPDNLHLRPDGQRYYAQLVHEATSEPASWTTEPGAVDPSSNSFSVAVTRTGCSGGETGSVYAPTVDIGDTNIAITFRVEPLDPRLDYTCPSNDTVETTVTLPEPIGQRQLVDGVCAELEGAACEFGAIRWAPELTPASTQEPVPWPTDIDRQSALEEAIDVPGSSDAAFGAYLDRASQLVSRCMSDGGFTYSDGDPVAEPAASERLNQMVEIDGQTIAGGCRQWSETLAFPGTYFADAYRTVDAEALAHPSYLSSVNTYDDCLIDAGYPRIPDVEGLSDSEAQTALDSYTSAALACEDTANLSDAKRALEIYVGDAFVARYPDQVQDYVVALTSYGILDPG
jgi:hypothetical protein